MYDLAAPAVYVNETVMANDTYRHRMERVVAALKNPVEPVVYADEQLPDLIKNHGLLANRRSMGTIEEVGDPALLFNTFRFDGKEEARAQWLSEQGCSAGGQTAHALTGGGAFAWACYNQTQDPNRNDKVCRPCWRIHFQNGCVHKCLYCGFGGLLVTMVNVEDYCHYLGQLMERHPWQQTFLLDDDGDPPGLEPELGCLGPMIEWFGKQENRYLVIHTKTWNTEWMRDLNHNGHTILVWSLSGSTQSRLIEPVTGTTEQRIEAARVAQDAGYQIRYKFKPIIPVRGWREDAAHAAKLLFERTDPDVISLCCFMWMDVDEMKRRLPSDLLDPDFLKAAEEDREEVNDTIAKPFPHRVRAEIYDHHLREIRKWNSEIPVSLSTENFRMWSEFKVRLGMTATNYPCGCGPQTVPGAPLLTDHPFKAAVRNDGGAVPGVVG